MPLLDKFLPKGLRIIKSIPSKCRLGFSRVLKGAINKVICTPDDMSCLSIANAIRSWGIPGGSLQLVREALAKPSPSWSNVDEEKLDLDEQNVKQCKRKICDGHYTVSIRVLSSFGIVPYNDATLKDLKAKLPLKFTPSLPHIPIDHHQLIASPAVVLDMIKSFHHGTSCGREVVNLFLDGKCPNMLGEYIASAPLTPLVKPRVIYSLVLGYQDEGTILHEVNRLIEDQGDYVGLSMLLADFKNVFNLVDHEAWYLNVDKTEGFLPKEDPRNKFAGVFSPNITRPLHGVKLVGGSASADFDFSSKLVIKRVAKSIDLMDAFAKINDPQCDVLLMRACAGISKLYFSMRQCSPQVFERAERSFDAALRSALEPIVTASGPRFGDWHWRLSTLPFAFGGLGVYSVGDVLN
nr:hypothetical protein [Tanacetum cinerariifolium]